MNDDDEFDDKLNLNYDLIVNGTGLVTSMVVNIKAYYKVLINFLILFR